MSAVNDILKLFGLIVDPVGEASQQLACDGRGSHIWTKWESDKSEIFQRRFCIECGLEQRRLIFTTGGSND